jgi:hypothetical protein
LDLPFVRRSKEQARPGLPAVATEVGSVRAEQDGIDSTTPLDDLVEHSPMNVLQRRGRRAPPTDHRLVGDQEDWYLETGELRESVE